MNKLKEYNIIGTMSGTSADAVDITHIVSNGIDVLHHGNLASYSYPDNLKEMIKDPNLTIKSILELEKKITDFYIYAISDYIVLEREAYKADVIAVHGQSIMHMPEISQTMQLINPHMLVAAFNKTIVADFRRADLSQNGQGAPLIPIYHSYLLRKIKALLPSVVINIGGVANISYFDEENLLAFDTGPGCAIIDDISKKYFHESYDKFGTKAASGNILVAELNKIMDDPYFLQAYPKSLDRNQFHKYLYEIEQRYEALDLLTTFTYLTAISISHALSLLPSKVNELILCGGGSQNDLLVSHIRSIMQNGETVRNIEDFGINSQAVEAEGFAYIAARTLNGIASSFPKTTGAKKETIAGVVYRPSS